MKNTTKQKAWRPPTEPDDDKVNKPNSATGGHLSIHSKNPINILSLSLNGKGAINDDSIF